MQVNTKGHQQDPGTNQLKPRAETSAGYEVASHGVEKLDVSLNHLGILGVKRRQFAYVRQKFFFVDEAKIITEPPTVRIVVVDKEIKLVSRRQ